MEDYLRRKGYITDFTGKRWQIRLPQYEHFTRLDTLDEKWTPDHFKRNMGAYARYGNRRAEITYPPQMPQDLRSWFKPFQKTSHIYRLYPVSYTHLDVYKRQQPISLCTSTTETAVYRTVRTVV